MPDSPINSPAGRRELARQVIYEHGSGVNELDDGPSYVALTYHDMVKAGIFEGRELTDDDVQLVLELIDNATIEFPVADREVVGDA